MLKPKRVSLPKARAYETVRSNPEHVSHMVSREKERVRTLSADRDRGTIKIERERPSTEKGWMPTGYYHVQCVEGRCERKDVTNFSESLSEAYSGRIPGRFGIVQPVLIAGSYSKEALALLEAWEFENESFAEPELFEKPE